MATPGADATRRSAYGPVTAHTVLDPVMRPWSNLGRVGQELRSYASQLPSTPVDPTTPQGLQAMHGEFAKMLDFQLRMSQAALAVELSSKTIEVGTSGINTLARTQT